MPSCLVYLNTEPFENRTVWEPIYFRPFENLTSPDFRIPVYKKRKKTESKLVKRVYLVKEESTEEGESLQGVETVEKEGELDNQDRVLQVLAKNPRDQFSNPGLKKRP